MTRNNPSREEISAFVNETLEKHSNYTQIVTLLGYGGFFALWAATADKMPDQVFAWAGALIGLSVLVFVAWELYKAGVTGRALVRLGRGDLSIEEYRALGMSMNRWWFPVFLLSTATGVVAGALILGWYIWAAITGVL